ncbi:MAG: bifunctional 2-polyprenyl-6-hydroxyphenol methylase/3-demethylubiquinol 3-O-methyltransferase UbiG [Pseudomonadales bacterium]|nr:bifunctional 2-polyprenyl-6-hydroxyphenol methylase/3-demethylubiquinol 3-O-methyltransferase UbiG [Pseudomonadales bacterium]
MNENVDYTEINKFELLAARWWDPQGDSGTLHHINPVRLEYITKRLDIGSSKAIDVGCGGGILTESLAKAGADITGIDMGEAALTVARLHALESEIAIDYQHCTAEQAAESQSSSFDLVCCMEMLEHVPEPASVIQACADLAKPGGHLFFSTINRNPKAWILAVLGAEYMLNLLPKGTHDYEKFVTPAELAKNVRQAGLQVIDICGMRYNPFTRRASLNKDVDVNYMLYAKKPLAALDESP